MTAWNIAGTADNHSRHYIRLRSIMEMKLNPIVLISRINHYVAHTFRSVTTLLSQLASANRRTSCSGKVRYRASYFILKRHQAGDWCSSVNYSWKPSELARFSSIDAVQTRSIAYSCSRRIELDNCWSMQVKKCLAGSQCTEHTCQQDITQVDFIVHR